MKKPAKKEKVHVLNKKTLFEYLSKAAEIDKALSDLVFDFFIENLNRRLLDGQIVHLWGFGHFYINCKMNDFEMKHHYYGNATSKVMFFPFFEASTITKLRYIQKLGCENLGYGYDLMKNYEEVLRPNQVKELELVKMLYCGELETTNYKDKLLKDIKVCELKLNSLKQELKRVENGKF